MCTGHNFDKIRSKERLKENDTSFCRRFERNLTMYQTRLTGDKLVKVPPILLKLIKPEKFYKEFFSFSVLLLINIKLTINR